jgi:hypothetical protein
MLVDGMFEVDFSQLAAAPEADDAAEAYTGRTIVL